MKKKTAKKQWNRIMKAIQVDDCYHSACEGRVYYTAKSMTKPITCGSEQSNRAY